jgi:UDP-N-acetylglucosamine--N-acetylmuramyl-(pentapeptide) pyrophosphoryl-undecaprenol N-acetylglucosamine transferase
MKNVVPCEYVFAGGGSGGHLTPLIPVSEQVKKRHPNARIAHIGQKGDPLNSITDVPSIDDRYTISAGKFRRYHGESMLRRVFDLKTLYFNIRDFFRFIRGVWQAWRLLGKLKPKVIFMKGGYVCAPVGIAAGWKNIPYITHDSDAMVSLAHRIISKKAAQHLTAMDPKLYTEYDQQKTFRVGVPVRAEYKKVTEAEQRAARQKLGISESSKVVMIVGGGQGAMNINTAVVNASKELLSDDRAFILHITGQKLYEEVQKNYHQTLTPEELKRVRCEPFSNELFILSAASDVIVTRAGATNMAEFAMQAKACIVVPNPLLTGGHQLKNARALTDAKAAIIVNEGDSSELVLQLKALLDDPSKQRELGVSLHTLAVADAAEKIADALHAIVGEGVISSPQSVNGESM